MNGANPPSVLRSSLQENPPDFVVRLVRRVRLIGRSLSVLSFWGAIALPSVYLPLLVAGIETTNGLTTFLVLFGLHVFALFGGRRHRRRTGR